MMAFDFREVFSNIFFGLEKEGAVLVILGFIWILASIVCDFRKREIPNWWNFSLIPIALAFRAFISIGEQNYWFFIWGLIGLGVFFIVANLFYYARLFAGGDAKLLFSLGAIFPLSNQFGANLDFLFVFLLSFLISGAVYGLIYSLFLAIVNFSRFIRDYSRIFIKYKVQILFFSVLMLVFVFIFFFFNQFLLAFFSLILFFSPFLIIYAYALETAGTIKFVLPSELTIGDWIVRPVKVKGTIIRPDWEGLSEKDLRFIQRYCKNKIAVKNGIPFTPAFLLAFLATIIFLYGFSMF